MVAPNFRYLRGYSLDPGFSTRLDTATINEAIYQIPFEKLRPGPVGDYVEVIDFDPASNCWYNPVDLSDESLASQNGLPPSEGVPQFHQQFVYAVAMKTIGHFEFALGRKVIWYPRALTRRNKRSPMDDTRTKREYVQRLRIHPHAMREANAYYDPDKLALLFGYFAAANQSQGANYPGGLVFTCLSPDIVAHEMTHAILDSIHHRYLEDTNSDVAAFHEGFADIVALLQRFTFAELVEHQLYMSEGRMDRYNVFGELATQFGEALEGHRGALRGMIGKWNDKGKWQLVKPDPGDYQTNIEAHERGAVLVATVFDAFQRLYNFRTRDLFRIASGGTGILPQGSINRDLVHRLAAEARTIAEHLLHICIRALDYCPPHDITFGNFLRALITADIDIAPQDEGGYRVALIEAFRARGIFPDRVNTLSVDSLRWTCPEFSKKQEKAAGDLARGIKLTIRKILETDDRETTYKSSLAARKHLERFFKKKPGNFSGREWEHFLNKLGLTSLKTSRIFGTPVKDVFLRGEHKMTRRTDQPPRVEVQTLRPAFRVSRRESRQIGQVVVTLTQRVSTLISEGQEPARRMVFRGGCSIIIDLEDLTQGGNASAIKYLISKNIRSLQRYNAQRSYLRGETEAAAPSTSLYADDDRNWRVNFNLLHQH